MSEKDEDRAAEGGVGNGSASSSSPESQKRLSGRSRRKPLPGISTQRAPSFSSRATGTPLASGIGRRSMAVDSPFGRVPLTAARGTPSHMFMFGGYSGLEEMREALKRQENIIDRMVVAKKEVAAEAEDARKARIEAELRAEELERRVESLTKQLSISKAEGTTAPSGPVSEQLTPTQREKALREQLVEADTKISSLEAMVLELNQSAFRAEKFLRETESRLAVVEEQHERDRESWRSMSYRKGSYADETQTYTGKGKGGSSGSESSTKSDSTEQASDSGDESRKRPPPSTTDASSNCPIYDEEDVTGEVHLETSGSEDDYPDDKMMRSHAHVGLNESVTMPRADWEAMLHEYSTLQNMKEVFQFGAAAQDSLRAAADAGRESEFLEISDLEAILEENFEPWAQEESEQEPEPDDSQSELVKIEREKSTLSKQLASAGSMIKEMKRSSNKHTVNADATNKQFQHLDQALKEKHQRQAALSRAYKENSDKEHVDKLRESLASSAKKYRQALTRLPDVPGRGLVQEHDMCQEEASALEQRLGKLMTQVAEKSQETGAQLTKLTSEANELEIALFQAEDRYAVVQEPLRQRLQQIKRELEEAQEAVAAAIQDLYHETHKLHGRKNERGHDEEKDREEVLEQPHVRKLVKRIKSLEHELRQAKRNHGELEVRVGRLEAWRKTTATRLHATTGDLKDVKQGQDGVQENLEGAPEGPKTSEPRPWRLLSGVESSLRSNVSAWRRLLSFVWAGFLYLGTLMHDLVLGTNQRVAAWSKKISRTKLTQRGRPSRWPQLQASDVVTVLFHVAVWAIILKAILTWWALKEQQDMWFRANGMTRAYYHDMTGCDPIMVDERFFSDGFRMVNQGLAAIPRWLLLVFDVARRGLEACLGVRRISA
ncbi:uncharacterized protein VDAG_01877 [Verticillium dahliae VdLs.17]|uniref:Uncharacterized protein n=1 Tax=Verticillium dahliae (strain VdLs.17 / ATCC MYA-4575 / FGSC 10137) TaxID=498257 RepID=G2WW91_VERDV|nr:uncharacterized protein VDAG_01877 [Verticillium dahliae VdLs.17]EGY19861.1 hypothetical protein VDAG_01877 [Verticillium dahliae VdLs.17]